MELYKDSDRVLQVNYVVHAQMILIVHCITGLGGCRCIRRHPGYLDGGEKSVYNFQKSASW